jgi:hypothetical protein
MKGLLFTLTKVRARDKDAVMRIKATDIYKGRVLKKI